MASLRRIVALIINWLPDLLLVSGAALMSYGAWLVYVPAGWMLGGAFLLTGGWLLRDGLA